MCDLTSAEFAAESTRRLVDGDFAVLPHDGRDQVKFLKTNIIQYFLWSKSRLFCVSRAAWSRISNKF